MAPYAQLVIGIAGSGKSTYCSTMLEHGRAIRREFKVINLDPAAEYFNYDIFLDIREFIHLDDVMEDEDLHFGPNGGLIFCFEYLVENLNWLKDNMEHHEDDYYLFDCPGQIELYTHLPVFKKFTEALTSWGFNLCIVNLMDSTFLIDIDKYLAGTMAALSIMVNLSIPHVNLLSKLDLLSKKARKKIENYLDPDFDYLLELKHEESFISKRREKLTKKLGMLLNDYSLVKFLPYNMTDETCLNNTLLIIDTILEYSEEVKDRYPDLEDPEDED